MEAKKHSYGGRQCMACGGMACNVSYEELRKQVEERGKAPMGDVRAGVDSKPSIAKGMMAPLGRMAKGGKVSGVNQQEGRGPHAPGIREGTSHSGHKVRLAQAERSFGYEGAAVKAEDHAKASHKQVLEELKQMKKPHLYADGGSVSSTGGGGGDLDYHPDEDKVKKMLQGAFGASEAKAEETPPAKKAEGGEVEGPADGDDEMLMDQCASECMEAIEKKDKSAFKDALQVLVSDMLRKLG